MNKIRLLKSDEIEMRVQKIFDFGVSVLLYKDARCDMNILDEVFGVDGWQDDYKEIKGNLYCTVKVKHGDEWISRTDCGIESRGNDGNEKKGEASDAFKRACTKVGIGRELYSAKNIWFSSNDVIIEKNKNNKLVMKDNIQNFYIHTITYDTNRKIDKLIIADHNNKIIFNHRYSDVINKEQRTRLFAIAKGDNNLARDILAKYNYVSTNDILKKDYDNICKKLEEAVKVEEFKKDQGKNG